MSLRTSKRVSRSNIENLNEMINVHDADDHVNNFEESKQFFPKTFDIVGGLCQSLKNANNYRLRIQEELKNLLRENSLRNKKD